MRHSPSLTYTLLLLTLAFVSACNSTPSGIPDEKEMALIMADVYRGEAVIDFNNSRYYNDSAKAVVRLSVLTAHGMTQEDFDSAMSWYGHHIEKYNKVLDLAVAHLEEELKSIPDDDYNVLMVAGDTADVWPMPSYRIVDTRRPSNTLKFDLLADETWEPGDRYELKLKMIGNSSPASALLAVQYGDSLTEYVTAKFSSDGWNQTVLLLDSTLTATRLYGYLTFDSDDDRVFYVDSMQLIRTRMNMSETFRRSRVKKFNLYGDGSDD